MGDWFPDKGDVVEPVIRTENWRYEDDRQKLPCGRFFIDEPEVSGRPRTMTINAVSAPLNANFTESQNSKAWKNINLKSIAQDIAKRAGLQLQWIGSNNPRYESEEQTDESDSSFLSKLTEDAGLGLKITDRKIVIFDEREFERKPSIMTLHEDGGQIISYDFKTQLAGTAYQGVEVSYYDSVAKRNIKFLYAPGELGEDPKIKKYTSKVRTDHDARRLAQVRYHQLNKMETTGTFNLMGNTEIVSGVCIEVRGFARFNGKYIVTKADHSLGSGYTTNIDIRKVLS
ncbi:probable bacteriophage regulatory protein [Geomicrobium sp. JCM 19037]|uniref:phage late control D family protein n=1 Tax=Geomicrobium sp. JCM 19037 TaxID=1460634 RepID=UPI00045F379A|nr:contractile injection system protein, VgrG/Pvc8 family [Geomicrobium sp. JCM 19037]GAK06027.1 probable bacteriophage regulatory protein [Geomicrobium sp. JCM 19037]